MSKSPTQSGIQLVSFLVKGLGTGWSPWMPGTAGSLLGLFLVYLLSTFNLSLAMQISMATDLTLLSWWLIALYEKQTNKHDDSQVVIDEIAGIMICLVGVPPTPLNLLAGFIVFRILDILKPFPIGWIDRKVPGALGTLLDDGVAGLAGCLFLHLFIMQGWL